MDTPDDNDSTAEGYLPPEIADIDATEDREFAVVPGGGTGSQGGGGRN